MLQDHLERRRSRRVYRLTSHRYFRAAFDLLCLRAEVGEVPVKIANWWQRFQEAEPQGRRQLLKELND